MSFSCYGLLKCLYLYFTFDFSFFPRKLLMAKEICQFLLFLRFFRSHIIVEKGKGKSKKVSQIKYLSSTKFENDHIEGELPTNEKLL